MIDVFLFILKLGAYEYLIKKATGEHIDVSRLFMYYNARIKDMESTSGYSELFIFKTAVDQMKTLFFNNNYDAFLVRKKNIFDHRMHLNKTNSKNLMFS